MPSKISTNQCFELVQILEIPKYITKVQTARARRPLYKKDESGNYLLLEGERIITNKRTAGTPRYMMINNNLIYSGFGSHHQRMTLVGGLKDFYRPFVRKLKPIKGFPLFIECEVYSKIVKNPFDLDNLASIYMKVFQDTLKEQGIIPDDNVYFISGFSYTFTPIEDFEEDRKLVFRFYKDNRAEALQFKLFENKVKKKKNESTKKK